MAGTSPKDDTKEDTTQEATVTSLEYPVTEATHDVLANVVDPGERAGMGQSFAGETKNLPPSCLIDVGPSPTPETLATWEGIYATSIPSTCMFFMPQEQNTTTDWFSISCACEKVYLQSGLDYISINPTQTGLQTWLVRPDRNQQVCLFSQVFRTMPCIHLLHPLKFGLGHQACHGFV